MAFPESLADRLYNETKRLLENHVDQLLIEVKSHGEDNLLQAYYLSWTKYSQGINYLHRLYLFLNQQHIKKQKLTDAEIIYGPLAAADSQELMEIGELGLDIWKNMMIMPLKHSLVSLLLEGIDDDRNDKTQPSQNDIICGVIESFVRVEEYKRRGQLDVRTNKLKLKAFIVLIKMLLLNVI